MHPAPTVPKWSRGRGHITLSSFNRKLQGKVNKHNCHVKHEAIVHSLYQGLEHHNLTRQQAAMFANRRSVQSPGVSFLLIGEREGSDTWSECKNSESKYDRVMTTDSHGETSLHKLALIGSCSSISCTFYMTNFRRTEQKWNLRPYAHKTCALLLKRSPSPSSPS